jgi:hypothetical protein
VAGLRDVRTGRRPSEELARGEAVVKKLGIVAAVIVLLLVVVIASTMRGSREPSAAPSSDPPSVLSDYGQDPDQNPDQDPASGIPVQVSSLPHTDQPDAYAIAVADVVFGLDTRDLAPAAYREVLLADADPGLTATGWADLEALIDGRIPADELWQRMRANDQWSAYEASDVWEPGSWEQVVTGGQAEPGWAMRNVTGIQTTHYVEAGVEKSSSRERTVTIGMRCPADGAEVDRCYLVLIGAAVVP